MKKRGDDDHLDFCIGHDDDEGYAYFVQGLICRFAGFAQNYA